MTCRICGGYGGYRMIGKYCAACLQVKPPWWRVIARLRWNRKWR